MILDNYWVFLLKEELKRRADKPQILRNWLPSFPNQRQASILIRFIALKGMVMISIQGMGLQSDSEA
jgi:hypothetical protein